MVVKNHDISPHRMQFVEHYPPVAYGEGRKRKIPRKFDAVEFVWEKGLAVHPKWRPVKGPLLDFLRNAFKGVTGVTVLQQHQRVEHQVYFHT